MGASDSKAIPQKNVALRITFPIFDADGDLVTGATGLDSEISKDAGTFADCTNEATEIATSSGMYYLDLTSTEMNADTVAIIVKTSSAGAKTTPIVLYTAARSINDLAWPTTTGRSMDVDASGGVEVGSFQTGAITTAAFTAGAIDAAAIAANAIGSSELASGAITSATFASGAITAAAIAADAIGASELAADAVTEIQSGLATSANQSTIIGYIDTEIAAILAAVDTEVAAIKAITDLLTLDGISDAVLSRAISNVEGAATFRSLAGAISKLVNKVDISGGTLTVRKTDDSTAYGTQAVTTDALAEPITEVDTA